MEASGAQTGTPKHNVWIQKVNGGIVLTERMRAASKCREVGVDVTIGSGVLENPRNVQELEASWKMGMGLTTGRDPLCPSLQEGGETGRLNSS